MHKARHALVPARGGSKGIRRKNLLPLDGVPLFIHAAQQAAEFAKRVTVSSDSEEILAIAQRHGFEPHVRKDELATDEATVDQVVADYRTWIGEDQELLVWQPTVVLTNPMAVGRMMGSARMSGHATALSAPIHGVWSEGNPALRKNRQQWSDQLEIGVRFYPAHRPTRLLRTSVTTSPYVDIDTWDDYEKAKRLVKRPIRIVFEAVVGPELGFGHLFRVLALAEAVQGWEPKIVLDGRGLVGPQVADIVKRHGFEPHWKNLTNLADSISRWPHRIWVKDTLDTDLLEVLDLRSKGWKVVSFEDLGEGRLHVDMVVNALYKEDPIARHHPRRLLQGPEYAVIRPEFLGPVDHTPQGNTVLVTFGGTDPAELTYRVASALEFEHDLTVRVIEPPAEGEPRGPRWMSQEMAMADVIVCSAGRTVLEAAAMGKPCVVLAQNFRELSHSHLGVLNGNISLGLGEWVTPEAIYTAVHQAIEKKVELGERARAMVDGRGVERIVREMERMIENGDSR